MSGRKGHKDPIGYWNTKKGKRALKSIAKEERASQKAQQEEADKNLRPDFVRDKDTNEYITKSDVARKGWLSREDSARDMSQYGYLGGKHGHRGAGHGFLGGEEGREGGHKGRIHGVKGEAFGLEGAVHGV